jgi:hypothetical protein
MKYMILIYGSQQDYDAMAGKSAPGKPAWSKKDIDAMGAFMEEINKELAERGELVDGQGLSAPVHTRRVQLQDGVPAVTDGPYPETAEVLAGYWVVDCESIDRATEIAARVTKCPEVGGAPSGIPVDVRPIDEGPPRSDD